MRVFVGFVVFFVLGCGQYVTAACKDATSDVGDAFSCGGHGQMCCNAGDLPVPSDRCVDGQNCIEDHCR